MKKLKFEGAAAVGDTIRGYDFKPMVGRNDCYVEGTVEAVTNEVGYKAFKVTCTKDVFDGVENAKGKGSRVGKIVFVPMEVSFMEYDARIINLTKF
jgi:hypothetical protein